MAQGDKREIGAASGATNEQTNGAAAQPMMIAIVPAGALEANGRPPPLDLLPNAVPAARAAPAAPVVGRAAVVVAAAPVAGLVIGGSTKIRC